MEASAVVTAPAAVADPEPSHDGAAEATRTTQELFQWSGYAHVGGDAEKCEHKLNGKCKDSKHFHAWVCLPNPYQIRDVQEKARAARARKTRALRDAGDPSSPDPKLRQPSDSYVILEDQLDEIRRTQYDELLQAIASRTVDAELFDIINDLREDERFEHQAQDAEEFQRQGEMGEDERDPEEYERLQKQMLDYADAMQAALDSRREREAERLKAMGADRVMDIERDFRIKQIGDEVFLHTYYTWVIYVGSREPTLEGFPTRRKFASPVEQQMAPPEVITALREKVRDLENATTKEGRGEAAGNS